MENLIYLTFAGSDDNACQQGAGGGGGVKGSSGKTVRAGGFNRNPTLNETKGQFFSPYKKGYSARQRMAKAKLADAAAGYKGKSVFTVGGSVSKTASDLSGRGKSRMGKSSSTMVRSNKLPRSTR
jgi:hypothetical protein